MCKKLLYSFTYYFLCRLKLLPQKYSLENCMKLPCVVLYTQPRLDSMLLILVYYVTYQSRYAVIEIYLPLFSPLFLFLCLICSALLLLSAFLFFLCLLPLSSLLSLVFFFCFFFFCFCFCFFCFCFCFFFFFFFFFFYFFFIFFFFSFLFFLCLLCSALPSSSLM